MKINKKLPAFTLMEVTIAMLIAGVAIAISFTAYRIVSGAYLTYTKKQERVAVFITADKLMKKDFLNAKRIIRTEAGLSMELQDGTITYELKNDYLLRGQYHLSTDTFKMTLKDINCAFEGVVAPVGTPVDECGFKAAVDAQEIPVHYQKKYSAQDLFR